MSTAFTFTVLLQGKDLKSKSMLPETKILIKFVFVKLQAVQVYLKIKQQFKIFVL